MSSYVLTEEVWRALLERDGYACKNCNSEEDLQPAHVVHRSLGGSNALENVILLCFKCHRKHHDRKLTIQRIKGYFFLKEVR